MPYASGLMPSAANMWSRMSVLLFSTVFRFRPPICRRCTSRGQGAVAMISSATGDYMPDARATSGSVTSMESEPPIWPEASST